MGQITNADRNAIRKIFRRIKPDIANKLAENGVTSEEAINLFVAQNTLRACMEVVFEQCLPYDQRFLMEIGSRLAAYAITAAPTPDHSAMTQAMAESLPFYVKRKVAEGATIKTEWQVGDQIVPSSEKAH